MAWNRLTQRVDALEQSSASVAVTRWHWVIQNLGETSEDALSRYEAENGPVGPTEGIIRWKTAT